MSPNTPSSSPELAFPATIRLDRQEIAIDGHAVNLAAGMTATVENQAGRRSVID